MRGACDTAAQFQSTLSMRRATHPSGTHLPAHSLFQSTLSMRRATGCLSNGVNTDAFQSTLSMRRATLVAEIVGE